MQASYCQTSATASPGAPKTPTAATPNVATPRVSSPSSNPLTAFATGLLRGLTTQPCTTTGQPYVQSPYVGGTGYTLVPVQTVNALGQVQTTYVQQPTTAGVTPYGTPCTPTTAQTAPYGVGTNGAACTQPPAMPQCAAGSTAEPISSSGNGCTTGYQCVPSGSSSTFTQPPTPQISCSPQVADANESVAITYSCLNATGSTGGGFSTNNQTSGTATSTLNPPAGTNTANFEITCTDGAQSANAQCQVQINHPAIVLVGNPAAVQSGKTSSIGWVTAGMQSCVISSPDDANFTSANAGDQNVNGVAETDPITGDTEFDLTCQTLGGQTKTASAMITVAASSSDSGGGE